MNSSLSLFILPSSSFISANNSHTESPSWDTGSSISPTPLEFGMLESSTLLRVSTMLDGEPLTVMPNTTSLTQLYSGSLYSRDSSNGTKKITEETTKGVNVVTIVLVICSCLLLWIIIIAIGLVKRRFERKKENIGGRDGAGSNELERSNDSTSSMPLHLRARMIYQGLQSYEISNQVPNGVTHTGGRLSITQQGPSRRESREHQHDSKDGLDVNGDTSRRSSSFCMPNHVENNNNSLTVSTPMVRIIVTEPSEKDDTPEVTSYDNEGMSDDQVVEDNDSSIDRPKDTGSEDCAISSTEIGGRVDDNSQTRDPEDLALTERPLTDSGEGVVNIGFSRDDIEDTEPNEQTTEL